MANQSQSFQSFKRRMYKDKTMDNQILLKENLDRIGRLSNTVEIKFQQQFGELENYLDQVLEKQHCKFASDIKQEEEEEEKKVSMAPPEPKELCKSLATETLKGFKAIFEQNQLHHLLPECYITQVFDNIRQEINLNMSQLTNKTVKSVSETDKSKLDPQSCKIKKAVRRGKHKLPKKAVIILKNWLTENLQDPYPSHSEKTRLANEAGVDIKQVQNWFTNFRGRSWRKSTNTEKFDSQIEQKLKGKDTDIKILDDKVKFEPIFPSPNNINMQLQLQLRAQMSQPIQMQYINPRFLPLGIFK